MSKPAKRARGGKKQKERQPKSPARSEAKPKGAAPTAMVDARHGDLGVHREAGGFSAGEIEAAGIRVSAARKWGVRVDDRRRTVLEGNVSSLKKWAPKRSTEARAEGEARKIEKDIEKDVRKVEDELKKVEKEVVEKVEAPVKRRSKKKEAAKENDE